MVEPKQAFAVMDCALITLATGKRAQNLRELRDRIAEVEEASLYHHFYENLLRPSFDDPEYRNDFALWAQHALHQPELAEKLVVLDPMLCRDLSELRQQILDVIEDFLAALEYVPWAKRGEEFHFLTSQVVVFDTGYRLATPAELAAFVPRMSTSSVFYHFIEARRRPPVSLDDFSAWLGQWEGTETMRARLAELAHFWGNLSEIRERLAVVLRETLLPDGEES